VSSSCTRRFAPIDSTVLLLWGKLTVKCAAGASVLRFCSSSSRAHLFATRWNQRSCGVGRVSYILCFYLASSFHTMVIFKRFDIV
jgi:hypothetical protein